MNASQTIEYRMLSLLQRLGNLELGNPPPLDGKISHPQLILLEWVGFVPGCGVGDIAKGLGLSAPTVSVGIRRLVKNGWLERRHDPDDKRARPLYMTPTACDLLQRLNIHRMERINRFLSGLDVGEQEKLLLLLEKAITQAESRDEIYA